MLQNVFLLATSAGFAVALVYIIHQHSRLKVYKAKEKELATDARQLLHDMTRGNGLVRISVLDPDGLFYWSTRGEQKR